MFIIKAVYKQGSSEIVCFYPKSGVIPTDDVAKAKTWKTKTAIEKKLKELTGWKSIFPVIAQLGYADGNPYTVTIAGDEAEEGHAPYSYVVCAPDAWTAEARVIAAHRHDRGDPDEVLVVKGYTEGVPDRDCNYHWNDLRYMDLTPAVA